MAPWLDRPLSVAGRVIVKDGNTLKPVLLNVDRDLCLIPNLAISHETGMLIMEYHIIHKKI